jgi:ferredoxin-type protein NapH
MKRIILALFLFVLIFSNSFPIEIEDRIRISVNWEITNIELQEKPIEYYLLKRGSNILGYAVETENYSNINGYGGPMNLLIIMDKDYYIQNVIVLSHTETRGFMEGIYEAGFFNQFKGRSINDILDENVKIDTISGATISCNAIIEIVKQSLAKFKNNFEYKGKIRLNYIFLIMLLCSIIISIRAFYLKKQNLRLIVLTINFIIFVIIFFELISLKSFYNLLIFNTTNLNNIIFLILILILVIIFGRIYCGYICPFTFIFELLYKQKKNRLKINKKIDFYLKKIKYIILILIILSFVICKNPALFFSQPFSCLTIHFSIIDLIIILSMVVIGLFIPFFWCKYLCPVGAIFGILSILTIFKKKIVCKDRTCKYCENICPYNAIKNLRVDQMECVLCQRCKCIKNN